MNKAEAIELVSDATEIYGSVKIANYTPWYFKLDKENVLMMLRSLEDAEETNVRLGFDGKSVYIN